ncbi:hypothetical protein ACWGRK_14540 [Saccharomonospora azurea]|uniref:hypothetical protein n=1 Tax=Saccharomonospora azurea TaxID=40988 RepID=UPI00055E7C4F|nr:hypothetical protein [Saccharomonospora azurea]
MRSPASRAPASRAVIGCGVLAAAGLVVAAVGTFLPWLRSGSVERDSYATAALLDHLLTLDPALRLALRAWNGVIVAAGVCVIVLVLGLWRTAASLITVTAITVGTVAALITIQSSDVTGLIGISTVGPATSTAGSALALLGGLGLFFATRRSATTHRSDETQDR